MDFGTAMHSGLQAYYEPSTWGNESLMRDNSRQAFLMSIKAVETKVKMGPLEFETRFDEQRELGLGMLEYYHLWAPKHDDFKPILVEQEFEVEIPGMPGVVCQGRIDLIAEDEYGYWIVDHKTTAQFGDVEWLPLDDQCSTYAWAALKQLGLRVRGVIYNELRKKVPRRPTVLRSGALSVAKNQDTTYETYIAAVREMGYRPKAYRDILLYLRDNPKQFIRRTRVQYTRDHLENVEKRIQAEAHEMLNDPAIYPTPSRFNCQGCMFFAPCLAMHEGRDYQIILDEMYEKRISANRP